MYQNKHYDIINDVSIYQINWYKLFFLKSIVYDIIYTFLYTYTIKKYESKSLNKKQNDKYLFMFLHNTYDHDAFLNKIITDLKIYIHKKYNITYFELISKNMICTNNDLIYKNYLSLVIFNKKTEKINFNITINYNAFVTNRFINTKYYIINYNKYLEPWHYNDDYTYTNIPNIDKIKKFVHDVISFDDT